MVDLATHISVDCLLREQIRLSPGNWHSHVQLSDRDLHTQRGVLLHDCNLIIQTWRSSHRVMSLQTHAINLDTRLLQHLHNPHRAISLAARPLDIVVIVVQLRVRVDLGRYLERELDVILAKDIVEDALAPGAILLEGFVYDIPCVALALVMFCHSGDVVDNNVRELLRGPLGLLDPRSELAVPDEGVAAEEFALLLGEIGGDVALCEIEDASLGFGEEPLAEIRR